MRRRCRARRSRGAARAPRCCSPIAERFPCGWGPARASAVRCSTGRRWAPRWARWRKPRAAVGRRRMLMVAALALVAVGVAAWNGTARERPLGTIERRDLVFTVDVDGELRALNSVTFGPPQVENIWNF